MHIELTEKEQSVLVYLKNHISKKGYPPSVREICHELNFKSTSTAHTYLKKLKKLGIIEKDALIPRGLKILNNTNDYENFMQTELVNIPIVGKVTAGEPILATENIEEIFPLPLNFVGTSDAFILKVKGDSMIDAGILDCDYILVKQQTNANNGEIIVALIGDESTVKRFFKETSHIRLQPENKHYEPIIVTHDFSILGKVIGVFRKI